MEAMLTILPWLRSSSGRKGLAALDHAHQVDRDLPIPVFQRQLTEEAARGHAGVVDYHIDAAKLLFTGLRQGGQLAVITHIATLGKAIAACRTHQLQGLSQAWLIHVRERQLPALTRPTQGDFTTQTRSRAGDHHAILHTEAALLCCGRWAQCSQGIKPPHVPSSL